MLKLKARVRVLASDGDKTVWEGDVTVTVKHRKGVGAAVLKHLEDNVTEWDPRIDPRMVIDRVDAEKEPAALKGRFGHAVLDCPRCSKPCRPCKKTNGGGASYRCYGCPDAKAHEQKYTTFRIDGEGELHW